MNRTQKRALADWLGLPALALLAYVASVLIQ